MRRFLLLLPLLLCGLAHATTYEIGTGKTFPTITSAADVLHGALPGDVFHLFPGVYREQLVLDRAGSAGAHIQFIGWQYGPGPRPTLEGQNMVMNANYHPSDFGGGLDKAFLVEIGEGIYHGTVDPIVTNYIDFENIEVRDADHQYTLTDETGNVVNWRYTGTGTGDGDAGSVGIYIINARNITIKNCLIDYNDEGLFGNAGGGYSTATKTTNIMVDGNAFIQNGFSGVPQNYEDHSSYIECANATYQNNYYGPLRSAGGSLKDRSSNTIIRYNWIEGGARLIDLVESEAGYSWISLQPNYGSAWVYGNIFKNVGNTNTENSNVHWGGDSDQYAQYRNGTLWFYNNTWLIQEDKADTFRYRFFDVSTDLESVSLENNIFWHIPRVSNPPPDIYPDMCGNGCAADSGAHGTYTIGKNIFPAYVAFAYFFSGTDQTVVTGLTNFTNVDPKFTSNTVPTFTLQAGSPAIGAASPLSMGASTNPVTMQYGTTPMALASTARSNTLDLGAFQYTLGGGGGGGNTSLFSLFK